MLKFPELSKASGSLLQVALYIYCISVSRAEPRAEVCKLIRNRLSALHLLKAWIKWRTSSFTGTVGWPWCNFFGVIHWRCDWLVPVWRRGRSPRCLRTRWEHWSQYKSIYIHWSVMRTINIVPDTLRSLFFRNGGIVFPLTATFYSFIFIEVLRFYFIFRKWRAVKIEGSIQSGNIR